MSKERGSGVLLLGCVPGPGAWLREGGAPLGRGCLAVLPGAGRGRGRSSGMGRRAGRSPVVGCMAGRLYPGGGGAGLPVFGGVGFVSSGLLSDIACSFESAAINLKHFIHSLSAQRRNNQLLDLLKLHMYFA